MRFADLNTANHPEIRSPYISDYKSSTEISYPVLIHLLEALPHVPQS